MKKIEKLKNFIMDNEFRMTFFENRIHVINYQELISLSDEKIRIKTTNLTITFTGTQLVLSKLLDQEIMIEGTLTKVEFEHE